MMQHWLTVTESIAINLGQVTMVRFGTDSDDGKPFGLVWLPFAVQDDNGQWTQEYLYLAGDDALALQHALMAYVRQHPEWVVVDENLLLNLTQVTHVRYQVEKDGAPSCLVGFPVGVQDDKDRQGQRRYVRSINDLILTGERLAVLQQHLMSDTRSASAPE